MPNPNPWINDWFQAGMDAWKAGKPRADYPFKKTLRRCGLDEVWKAGWDTAAMLAAVEQGARARPGDRNPYTDPELASSWTRGWNARHGLSAVGDAKNPAPRGQDARPGRSEVKPKEPAL